MTAALQFAEEPQGRADLVAAAVEEWAEQLAGLGGRSTLLHFRDLKTGTLDLAAADAEARRRLVEGQPTPISRLFPHEPLRSSATRSARAVRDKARELFTERGLHGSYLAVGIATWSDPFAARRPTAPVLLRPARVEQVGGAGDDLLITVSDQAEVNPVLLWTMAEQLGLRIQPDDLLDPAGALRYPVVVERLREFAPPHVVDGFSVAHRAVLGTFATTDTSLRDDVLAAAGQVATHDVLAALAGDAGARDALHGRARAEGGDVEPALVLDLDAGQEAAVRAALAGDSVVLAPPGTGATQTVASVVAGLVGSGRTALVVAARRDDADGVARRLAQVGLGGAVLDAADGLARADLAGALVAPLEVDQRDGDDEQVPASVAEEAARRADAVAAHRETMHRPREPWGISAYAAQAVVAGTDPSVRCAARIDASALARMHGEARAAVRAALREYADLGGLSLGPGGSPWYGALPAGAAGARATGDRVARLASRGLPDLRDAATRAAVEVGLPGPATPDEALETVRLLERASDITGTFHADVWGQGLDELVAATGTRAWRRQHGGSAGWLARRRLRADARDLVLEPASVPDRAMLHRRLGEARELRREWGDRARDGRDPRVGDHHDVARQAAAEVRDDLDALTAVAPGAAGLGGRPWGEAHRRLAELAADEQTLLTLPRLHDLESTLRAAGVSPVVEELRERSADTATAVTVLDHAWHASLIALWREQDPGYGAVDPDALDLQEEAFRRADLRLQEAAAAAVRQVHARRVAAAVEEHPGQAALMGAQRTVAGHSRHLADLVRAAPDVALALKPCWVASPYTVPGLLPAQRLFDVVVVLGAGGLRAAEAVPALLRGSRVVLVGGAHEPVPPTFSVAVEQEPEDDDGPPGRDEVSLLEALGPHLPVHELTWHHASRDERLVGFANGHVFGGRLVTAPAAVAEPDALRHVLVTARADAGEPADSVSAEVEQVVDLVVEQARRRPYESLAVVALGAQHARRVEAALRARLAREPGLDDLFADNREEPFVVTHLGRPPLPARDALILTVGYGRTVDGRVLYRFGGLGRPGGERRLAAVLARTRARFTLVSSFGSVDLNERRLTSEGALLLRDLLSYVEGGGRTPSGLGSDVADPLEEAVRRRLADAGVSVVPHVGASSRRLGLAVRHPSRPGRYVLAVDTDGPAWAAAGSVRESARLVPEELGRRGWLTHRVWSAAWAADPDREVQRLLDAYDRAVQEADTYDAAVAAAVNDAVVGPPDGAVESARAGGAGREARDRGERPPVRHGRDAGGYPLADLVALARWVESDAALRTEGEAAREVAGELGLDPESARVDQLLRHAVRAARAAGGGPGLDEELEDGSETAAAGPGDPAAAPGTEITADHGTDAGSAGGPADPRDVKVDAASDESEQAVAGDAPDGDSAAPAEVGGDSEDAGSGDAGSQDAGSQDAAR